MSQWLIFRKVWLIFPMHMLHGHSYSSHILESSEQSQVLDTACAYTTKSKTYAHKSSFYQTRINKFLYNFSRIYGPTKKHLQIKIVNIQKTQTSAKVRVNSTYTPPSLDRTCGTTLGMMFYSHNSTLEITASRCWSSRKQYAWPWFGSN